MMVFKGCGRCQGDLFVERDIGNTDLVCLQCGFRRTIRSWFEEDGRHWLREQEMAEASDLKELVGA